jgi:benzoyl-CoA reductase/2-hydroxyglutaryl-CoA dehydratase subunit BcrC/BadD/HgdB
VPVDLFYAFDTQPYYLDQLPLTLAPNPAVTSKFIDIAERVTNQSMCALDKVELGVLLAGQYGVEPDAFVYSTLPCDSSRIAYPNMQKILGKPTYTFDTPFRRDARGKAYQVKQVKEFITFMEELTGHKLDWDRYKEVMKVANRTNELLELLADLRKETPCPLPGQLLIANCNNSGMGADPKFTEFLEKEYEVGQFMVEMEMGACPEEKYRMLLLQNMLWTSIGTYSRLEQECGAIAIMDVLGHFWGNQYEHPDDPEDCFRVLADKMQGFPMIHGAAGPVDYYLDRIKYLMDDFNINTSIFLGHVGCKHTWASTKILSEFIQSNYGIPTFNVDVDCIDNRYKSGDQVFNEIKEYLETVVRV